MRDMPSLLAAAYEPWLYTLYYTYLSMHAAGTVICAVEAHLQRSAQSVPTAVYLLSEATMNRKKRERERE